MKVIIFREADEDLLAIFRYLAARNPVAAETILGDINQKFLNLTHFPFIGRDRSSLRSGIRSIVAGMHVISIESKRSRL